MKYLLDPDIASYYLRGRYNLVEIFQMKGISEIRLSIVSIAELQVLAFKNPNSVINHLNIQQLADKVGVMDVDRTTWRTFSMIKAKTELSGKPKGDFDILQAAIANQHGLIVVTNNTDHFESIVEVENWID